MTEGPSIQNPTNMKRGRSGGEEEADPGSRTKQRTDAAEPVSEMPPSMQLIGGSACHPPLDWSGHKTGGAQAAKCLETSVIRLAGTVRLRLQPSNPKVWKRLSKVSPTVFRKPSKKQAAMETWHARTGEPGTNGQSCITVGRVLQACLNGELIAADHWAIPVLTAMEGLIVPGVYCVVVEFCMY